MAKNTQNNEINFPKKVIHIRNWHNYRESQDVGEINHQPSKTIPDQTMSMSEIMRRFARGLPIEAGKFPIYHGEEMELPHNFSKMDLTDQHAIMSQNADYIKETQQILQNRKKPKPKEEINEE